MSDQVGPDQWECSVCTFINSSMLPQCGMCGSLAPVITPGPAGGHGSVGVDGGDDLYAAAKTAMEDVSAELKATQMAYYKVSPCCRCAGSWKLRRWYTHHANAVRHTPPPPALPGCSGSLQWC